MFRSIQNHPVALLVVAAGAFVAWLLYDAAPASAARTEPSAVRRELPRPLAPHPAPHGDPRARFAHLPPGAPRALVEHQLGLTALPSAASAINFEVGSYTVTYPLPGRPLVLEFDATQDGHPLVGPRDLEPHS